jgi:hypothetical protein
VDPDWIRIQWLCGSGSRGKKIKKFQWKNALFSYFLTKILPLKRYRYKIALPTFWKKFWWITPVFLFDLTQILIFLKVEKEIVFESSVLAWIRIDQKCWIRIRNKSIRIYSPAVLKTCHLPVLCRILFQDFNAKHSAYRSEVHKSCLSPKHLDTRWIFSIYYDLHQIILIFHRFQKNMHQKISKPEILRTCKFSSVW